MIPEYDCDRCGNHDLYEQLRADADRFAALRLMMTEPDITLRAKMLDVFDQNVPEYDGGEVTPEQVNEVFDAIFAACAKLRVESNPL